MAYFGITGAMRTCATTGMEFLLEPKDGAGLGQDAGVMSLGKYTVMFQTGQCVELNFYCNYLKDIAILSKSQSAIKSLGN